MSKWQAILGVVLCVGCGGAANNEQEETQQEAGIEGDSPVVDIMPIGSGDGVNPAYIDVVEVSGHEYRFIQVFTEEGAPSVMVMGAGPGNQGSPELSLRLAAPVHLTPAELWANLTHSDDVPLPLAEDHIQRILEQGRASSEYVRVQPMADVNKAAPVNQQVLLPPPAGAACIDRPRWGRMNNFTGVPRFGCTELQAGMQLGFWGTGVAANNGCCQAKFNIGGDIRIAMYNDGSGTAQFQPLQTVQFCYGPSSAGAWVCYAAEGNVGEGQYRSLAWNDTAGKRMSFGISNPRSEGVIKHRNWYATGRYILPAPGMAPPVFGGSGFCQNIEGGEFAAGGSLHTCQ